MTDVTTTPRSTADVINSNSMAPRRRNTGRCDARRRGGERTTGGGDFMRAV
jgi:hypothetical protein